MARFGFAIVKSDISHWQITGPGKAIAILGKGKQRELIPDSDLVRGPTSLYKLSYDEPSGVLLTRADRLLLSVTSWPPTRDSYSPETPQNSPKIS
jgi:hypothetical protein